MDNFDYKKYLANNPLTEAYTPGSGWTKDFEYDDMMAHGLTLTADDSIEDLRKVAEDFTDVNYHREAAHLYDAIDAIEAGDRGEAKMYINKFRKEIKATLGGWDDVNEAQETMLTDDLVQRVAQAVADEFTSEDNELDLKYVITPNSIEADPRGGGFDLDVEAGPNTPGDDWEDSKGFSIANYLGDYAGGSFVIRPEGDGYLVTNAASRNAKVAYITPEGEIEIISAEDSKADLGMTDDVETDYMERRKEMSDYMEEGEEEIKEIKSNKMKKSELKEIIKAAMLAEAEEVDVKDNEEVDVDIEKEVDIDDESVESDIEVDASMPGESGDEVAVQSLLMKAQEEAAKLGDEKLTDQIGNTITYFTRAHVATVDEGEEKNSITFNEEFIMAELKMFKENGNILDEGIFDRVKAKVKGAATGVKTAVGNVVAAAKGDVGAIKDTALAVGMTKLKVKANSVNSSFDKVIKYLDKLFPYKKLDKNHP